MTTDPITEKQIAFISRLMDERDLFASPKWFDAVNAMGAEEYKAHVARTKANLRRATRGQASAMIDALLALPVVKAAAPNSNLPDVPAGRYALTGTDGTVKFYVVDRPEEGRWAGFTFLSAQASDDLHPIKERMTKQGILERIAEDPEGASRRYGIELGVCGVCGRTLTDEVSRAEGIGPVCAGKMNWTTADRARVEERKEHGEREALAR